MKLRFKKTFVVYMAVNQVTGGRYIGASNNFQVRKRDHLHWAMRGSDGCKKFYRSIRKYGPGSFEWVILDTLTSKKEAFAAEVRFIAKLKPELNLTRGGEGIVGWKRTRSWRKSVSKALKGKPLSGACVSASHAARSKGFRAVVCLNDGKFFETMSSAAKFYGIDEGGVKAVVDGNACFTKGFSFVETKEPIPEDQRAFLLAAMVEKVKAGRHKSKDWKRRAVLCVEEGKEYPSQIEAAKACGLSVMDVSVACRLGKRKKNLSFRFLN